MKNYLKKRFASRLDDEKGLSTLEWILLVAAVGGLATAGVIIVKNAVGEAGDTVSVEDRLVSVAQLEVDIVMWAYTIPATNQETSLETKCEGLFRDDDKDAKRLRNWRGEFKFEWNAIAPTNTYQDGECKVSER